MLNAWYPVDAQENIVYWANHFQRQASILLVRADTFAVDLDRQLRCARDDNMRDELLNGPPCGFENAHPRT